MRVWMRIGLLLGVTLGAGLVYVGVIVPWYRNWGATPAEARQALPGDSYLPALGAASTHAVTIQAPPEAVWPWLAQMGQDRGGLYSYEFLENLIGCDMHNADRIHPEWQQPQVGDPVRFLPSRWLGLVDSPYWTIAVLEPHRALVVPGFAAFVLQPIDGQTTRLIMRMAGTGGGPLDAVGFIMGRRTLLGIQEHAEGRVVPSAVDALEVLAWMVDFAVSLIAGVGLLRRGGWRRAGVLAGAVAVLLLAVFARPPLPVSLGLTAALPALLWWAGRAAGAVQPRLRTAERSV